jgi:hypothetical protein
LIYAGQKIAATDSRLGELADFQPKCLIELLPLILAKMFDNKTSAASLQVAVSSVFFVIYFLKSF